MKKFFVICIMALLLCGCNSTNNVEKEDYSCDQIKELIQNGAVLIDVRTEEEYEEYHLDNSINIPVDEILDGVMALDLSKETKIIVYCKSGNRSNGAYRELLNNGYENVIDFGSISKCD